MDVLRGIYCLNSFEGEEAEDRFALRADQLLYRRIELYSAYKYFKQLISVPWDQGLLYTCSL